MGDPEKITIHQGSMINLSNHEDDDALVVTKDLEAYPLGPKRNGGIPVRIPALDSDRTYFFHQPEEKQG